MSWQDDPKVEAVLADIDNAPISPQLKATLHLLRKVTKEPTVTVDDMKTVLAAGVTKSQIEDALAVCFAFNVITRLADAFEFHVGPRAAFDGGAKHLLKRGYSL
jgi:hypothetical protein